MLISKIELENFKAFRRKHVVKFATDKTKNVTIIMGDNGSGKTTLAQAFLWCLYGESSFSNTSLLNLKVKQSMQPEEKEKVRVAIDITHESQDCRIVRTQHYIKGFNELVESNQPSLEVLTKNKGMLKPLDKIESEIFVKKMLPKELSRFFFFDGERIHDMSKELLTKRQSKEFADAVRKLVGLTAMINAIDHLRPGRKTTVIGNYENEIDKSGGKKLSEYGRQLDILEEQSLSTANRIEEIKQGKTFYEGLIFKQQEEILKYSEAEQHQKKIMVLANQEKVLREEKVLLTKNLLEHFQKAAPQYFAKHLVIDSLKLIKELGSIDMGVPDVTGKSIEFLKKRGRCICGTELVPGTPPYEIVCEAADYLPPKSVGVMISDFVNHSSFIDKQSSGFAPEFFTKFEMIRKKDNHIQENLKKQADLRTLILGVDKVAEIREELTSNEKSLTKLSDELEKAAEKKGEINNKLDEIRRKREGLIAVDKNNREVVKYRCYAKVAYEKLKEVYDEKEKETRERLEQCINEVFTNIYSDAICLEIDQKYRVITTLSQISYREDNVEKNTAQSYSIIFAFIAGIIKMVKENAAQSTTNDNELFYVEEEGYPLVMDAPLSAFDKTRIKNICNSLPKIARQIIIFIKDTDGDIAELNMSMVIGKSYQLTIDSSLTEANLKEMQ